MPIRPKKIRLEASSFCQLRCPSCPTTYGIIHPAVGSGFLRLADFRKLVDDNPQIAEIELSNYGEIFLNPDLLDIMAYAQDRGVALCASNGVNLNNARDEVLEGLVKFGFRSISCSIDGASAETYSQYRVRGSFERVLENIRKINGFKERYESELPALTWQFIIFGHNEHEILDARKMATDLSMKFVTKLSWDNKFSPIRNREQVMKDMSLAAATRDEYKREHGHDYVHEICNQLWEWPQINWDGKVLGCCINYWGDFGANAFTEGLVNSINNEKMNYARDMLQGNQPARDDIPCTKCHIYLGMKDSSRFFKAQLIHSSHQSQSKELGRKKLSNTKTAAIPNIAIIIGSMRCGTTSLYNCIAQHPEVAPCITKEPEFFSETESHGVSVQSYWDLWPEFDPNRQTFALEASTGYTRYPAEPNVPRNIYEYGVNPKILYITRNPFARIESHHHYMVRKNAAWNIGIVDDLLINISNYFLQLKRFTEYFSRDQILAIKFEDMLEDTDRTFGLIFDFLGLPHLQQEDGYKPLKKSIVQWDLKVLHQRHRARFVPLIPPVLSESQKQYVYDQLYRDMQNLRKEYEIDVSEWGFF